MSKEMDELVNFILKKKINLDELTEIVMREKAITCPSCKIPLRVVGRDEISKYIQYGCDSCVHTEIRNYHEI